MSDSPAERVLTYRLAAAYDCWGRRRDLRCGTRNGIWFIDPTALNEEPLNPREVTTPTREDRLREFFASGRFTAIEIATLHALVVERLTIAEIAERDGCSRQAVVARLLGNSRGQGGILKKAQTLLSSDPHSEDARVQHARRDATARQSLRRTARRRGRAA